MKKPSKKTAPKKLAGKAKPKAKAAKPAKKETQPKHKRKKEAAAKELNKKTVYEADKVYELPLEQIVRGNNYRTQFPEDEIAELAASIKSTGLIQPITVRPSGADGLMEIVAGERRYLAHQKAGLKTIRCLVNIMDEEQARVSALIENMQRSDVHPMDEANAFFELTRKKEGEKKAAFTAESLAKQLGVSKSFIFKRMKLRELSPKAQELFRNDKISYNHALVVSRIEPAVQDEAIKWLEENSYNKTVDELREYLVDELFIDISEAPFDLLETELVSGCGACIACPKRTINNSDFQKPDGWDENEEYDKCTDKNCFYRKVDAHRELAIKANTGKDGKLPLLGAVDYSFASQLKIGSTVHLFSRKKQDDRTVPVVITKQTNGKELIGTVVYIADESKKQQAAAKAGSDSGIAKLTGKSSSNGSNNNLKQELEEAKLKDRAQTAFIDSMLAVLFSRAIEPKKDKPFPAITAKQLMMFMDYFFSENGVGFHETPMLMLLVKWANPEMPDHAVSDLVTGYEESSVSADGKMLEMAEKYNILSALEKANELTLLRLGWTFVVAMQQYRIADENNTLFDILRNEGKNPEELLKSYTEQFINAEKEVAAQE